MIRPPHAAAAGLLLSAVPAGDIDRQRRAEDVQHQHHGAQQHVQQRLRAVSLLQPPHKSEHRPVCFAVNDN